MEIFVMILEIVGTVAFAISGVLAAMHKKMDIFGAMILGLTTAVGGGILRDLLLNITPPAVFCDPVYAATAVVTAFVLFVPGVAAKVAKMEKRLLVMDSIGLSVFTVLGVHTGMVASGNPYLAMFVGVLTGVGGGVLRDLFTGERPYIFVKHFYACASIIGALVCAGLWPFGSFIAMGVGASVIFLLRILAAIFRWSLPHISLE
jgi:uncharacterized membrane protein YeiH